MKNNLLFSGLLLLCAGAIVITPSLVNANSEKEEVQAVITDSEGNTKIISKRNIEGNPVPSSSSDKDNSSNVNKQATATAE